MLYYHCVQQLYRAEGSFMFSQVLDCPFCRKRFNYEQTDKTFPENLTCPECGQTGPYQDFSAIILCHQCRKKVMVPLELLYNDDTLCPHCQTVLKPELPFLDEDASTYTYHRHGSV